MTAGDSGSIRQQYRSSTLLWAGLTARRADQEVSNIERCSWSYNQEYGRHDSFEFVQQNHSFQQHDIPSHTRRLGDLQGRIADVAQQFR